MSGKISMQRKGSDYIRAGEIPFNSHYRTGTLSITGIDDVNS